MSGAGLRPGERLITMVNRPDAAGVAFGAARPLTVAPLPFEVRIAGLRLTSPNVREHYLATATRRRSERGAVANALAAHAPPSIGAGLVVTIVRCSPLALDDDNATAAAKSVRDEIACWLGVDDRDPRVSWSVGQAAASRGAESVVVRVNARGAARPPARPGQAASAGRP